MSSMIGVWATRFGDTTVDTMSCPFVGGLLGTGSLKVPFLLSSYGLLFFSF